MSDDEGFGLRYDIDGDTTYEMPYATRADAEARAAELERRGATNVEIVSIDVVKQAWGEA